LKSWGVEKLIIWGIGQLIKPLNYKLLNQ